MGAPKRGSAESESMFGLRFGPDGGGDALGQHVHPEVCRQNEIGHHPDIKYKRSQALAKLGSVQGPP